MEPSRHHDRGDHDRGDDRPGGSGDRDGDLDSRDGDLEPGGRRPALPAWVVTGGALSWRLIGIGIVGWALVQVLIRLRLAVVPLILATFLAALLNPPVRWLRRHGWPSLAATWLMLLAVGAVLFTLGFLIAPGIADQFDDLGRRASEGVDEVLTWLREGPLGLSDQEISAYIQQLQQRLQVGGQRLARQAVSGVMFVGELITGLLLTIVLAFFLVKDGERITAWLHDLVAPSGRGRDTVAVAAQRAWGTLYGYLLGTALVGAVDATLIGAGLAILGVPLVLPLMVITFFGAFFPLVGATVSGAIAALVALVAEGPRVALLVVALTVVVQQVEGDLVAPLIFRRTVRLHPIVVLLALTAGGVLGGILGAFLAVPVVAVAAAIIGSLRERHGAPAERVPAERAPKGTEPGRDAAAGGG